MAVEENYIFMALTESHQHSDITSDEINISNYTIFRKDRSNRSHGGVINYVRSDLAINTSEVVSHSDGICELLGILLKDINTLLFTVYRPPNSDEQSFKLVMDKVLVTINTHSNLNPEVIMVGDFNFPQINWNTREVQGGTRQSGTQAKCLLDLMMECNLTQHIQEPTRINNILDLVLTKNPEGIHSYNIEDTILSDHKLITVYVYSQQLAHVPTRNQEQIPQGLHRLNFHNADIDWNKIQQRLGSINWEKELQEKELDDMISILLEKCNNVCMANVPPRKQNSNSAKRIPRDRRILFKKRKYTMRKLKLARNTERAKVLKEKVSIIEEKIMESHKEEKRREELKAVAAIKTNSKYFFSYAKKNKRVNAQIGPLIHQDGSILTSQYDIAEQLRMQYEKSFSTPLPDMKIGDPTEFFRVRPEDTGSSDKLLDLDFSINEIEMALSDLNPSSAAGPDGMPAILLKNCKKELAVPLHIIWRKSLTEGICPESMKYGLITPIHKGGSRGDVSKYRPVVLTSFIIKTFEKVIREQLTNFFDKKGLFNCGQHGFRKGRSCLSQLLAHQEYIMDNLEEGNNVDVIYLDFAKAFDKVDHGVLLHRLSSLGIRGNLGRWIHSFLHNRVQQVAVNGTLSERSPVKSGVPQGSVLGPFLFLALISNIDADVRHSVTSSFADDTRIARKVKTDEDAALLQEDLNTIYSWATKNNMMFNESKFEVLRYGNDISIKENTSYNTNQGPIEVKNSLCDLGVTVSSEGRFSHHILNITESARRLSGWILRTFTLRDETCLMTLWKSLVLPKLEYCCQLWSPTTIGEIEKLESVQRTFTSKIRSLSGKNYWERLKHLKLYSLQRRRERYQILYTWKMLEGLVPNIGIRLSLNRTRGRSCYIEGPKTNCQSLKTLRAGSYSRTGPKIFNSLPSCLRDMSACSVEVFKRQLDHFLQKIEDTPPLPSYQTWPHYNKLEQLIPTYLRQNGGYSGSSCS